MSLGTHVDALPKEVTEEVAGVFAKMPQKVTKSQRFIFPLLRLGLLTYSILICPY